MKKISKSDSYKVLREVHSFIECKICCTPMVGHVWQCSNGHIVCTTCKSKCQECPYCKDRIDVRNLALERLFANYWIPCPHSGCKHRCKHGIMPRHMEHCMHKPQKCLYCAKLVSKDALQEHFITEHQGVLHHLPDSNTLNMTYSYAATDDDKQFRWNPNLFEFKENMFLITARTTPECVTFSVFAFADNNAQVSLTIHADHIQFKTEWLRIPRMDRSAAAHMVVNKAHTRLVNGRKTLVVIISFK